MLTSLLALFPVLGVAKYSDEASSIIKNIFKSIKDAPGYPKGFKTIKNGTKKVNIKNLDVLEELRKIEPGEWKKIYKNGYDDVGNKISVHYFESKSGLVFDVKIKDSWSTW